MFEVRLEAIRENEIDNAAIPEGDRRLRAVPRQWRQPFTTAAGKYQSCCFREDVLHLHMRLDLPPRI